MLHASLRLLVVFVLISGASSYAAEDAPALQPAPLVKAPPLTEDPASTVEATPPGNATPTEAPPHGEVFPRAQQQDELRTARLAGRLILQLPAGFLLGGALGYVGILPSLILGLIVCPSSSVAELNTGCVLPVTYVGVGLVGVFGVGVGVGAIGALMSGHGQFAATLGGALGGAVLGLSIVFASGATDYKPFVFTGLAASTLGAMAAYALSDSLSSESTITSARANKGLSVLPMLGPTPSGGISGGLVGRF